MARALRDKNILREYNEERKDNHEENKEDDGFSHCCGNDGGDGECSDGSNDYNHS